MTITTDMFQLGDRALGGPCVLDGAIGVRIAPLA